jgi:hypothetical protein
MKPTKLFVLFILSTKSTTFYTENKVISILEFLINNILIALGGKIFPQSIDIHLCTNGAPLLVDHTLYQ